jgi:hypothetical protein
VGLRLLLALLGKYGWKIWVSGSSRARSDRRRLDAAIPVA